MSEINMNEWANRYYYNVGVNPIPIDSKTRIPKVPYKDLQYNSLSRLIFEEWKEQGLYNDGIGIICGLIHRGKNKGLYLHAIDIDDELGIKEITNVNNVQKTLEELSEQVVIEQHLDDRTRAHILVYSKEPFPNLSAAAIDGIPRIEVKGPGKLITVTPSKHKNGKSNYELIGNSLKSLENPVIHTEFKNFVNDIMKRHDVDYLNGEGESNISKIPINMTEKIREGSRHDFLLRYADSTLRRLYDTTPPNIIKKMVQDVNLECYEPPLPDEEVEQIWNDALKFISEQVTLEDLKGKSSASTSSTSDKGEEDKNKKSKVQVAFETVRQQVKNLFIDQYQIPHVAIPIQDHLEVLPINSGRFKNWYRMFIFERDRIVLDSQTINDTCSLASAYAASSKYGAQINLNLRTALKLNFRAEWIYDLVNKNWEFIKITSNGWEIFKDEIIFTRYTNQQAQVYPDRNYEADVFDKFMGLVNTKDKDSILLLKCYIISLFIPEIQKVILILHGSQGAAKSSLQELIKMLVDPSVVKTLTFPRDINELIQQLSHNYITYYDNISMIKYWISDQLCRAVTGSGSSKRQLYTDDDDKIYSFKRCVGMNGINLAATKEDLLDRSIIINLEEIEDEDRRLPKELWEEFNALKPQLFGYILDVLVKVLEYEENNTEIVNNFQLSRMTEFAKYGEIISRCMGNKDNEFLNAYKKNREIQVDEIVEFSQVATAIMCMMFKKYDYDVWDGTPTALYTEIRSIAETDKWELNIDTGSRQWPKSVNSLTRRLNEVKPILKAKGLVITKYRENDEQRTKKIKIRKIPSMSSISSRSDKSRSNSDENLDGITDGITDDIKHGSTQEIGQNPAQNERSGRWTILDDTLHVFKDDLSRFIKVQGIKLNDQIVYDADPLEGNITLVNNFLTGHLRVRGESGGRYPTNYVEFIDRVFGPEPNTIEVCSNKIAGLNKGGNCYTVDINPEYEPDLVADSQNLEKISENCFNRWRCDPPYNETTAREMYNCELPSLSKLLQEGARVVKPGSLMFLLCSKNVQSGTIGKGNIKRIGFITISIVPNNETRILNIYVKLPLEETLKND